MVRLLFGSKAASFVIGVVLLIALWKANNGDVNNIVDAVWGALNHAADAVLGIWHHIFGPARGK